LVIKLRYSDYIVVDGDTLRVKTRGEWRYVRIIGLDADEMSANGSKGKRARQQARKLKTFMRRWPKPKLKAKTGMVRNKRGYFFNHHNGRILAFIYVWSWRSLGYVDYASYMKSRKMVKKNSRWNK